MTLTKEVKEQIDSMVPEQLVARWRYTPAGDPLFQGESGDYLRSKFTELTHRKDFPSISKRVG